MSLWPWAVARCSGVSSPMLVALILAPRWISKVTKFKWPSLAAQCKGLKPWSSLFVCKTQGKLEGIYRMYSYRFLTLDSCRVLCHPTTHEPAWHCLPGTSEIYLPWLLLTVTFKRTVEKQLINISISNRLNNDVNKRHTIPEVPFSLERITPFSIAMFHYANNENRFLLKTLQQLLWITAGNENEMKSRTQE